MCKNRYRFSVKFYNFASETHRTLPRPAATIQNLSIYVYFRFMFLRISEHKTIRFHKELPQAIRQSWHKRGMELTLDIRPSGQFGGSFCPFVLLSTSTDRTSHALTDKRSLRYFWTEGQKDIRPSGWLMSTACGPCDYMCVNPDGYITIMRTYELMFLTRK